MKNYLEKIIGTMKIKLLVDAHIFDDSFQGTTTYLSGLYNSLVIDSEFEIYLAASNTDSLKSTFTNERFKFINLPKSTKFKRILYDFPRIIKQNKIDIAHFQYITPPIKNCKYINTIHDLLFIEYPQYFPLRYKIINYCAFFLSAINSDLICTVSEYSKSSLIKYFKIRENKLLITPNGMNPVGPLESTFINNYNHGLYLLFVGRMEPRKNHLLLLKAYVELKLYNQNLNLVFIGKIKDLEVVNFNIYYKNLPIEIKNRVIILQDISKHELEYFYKNASLFVYTSVAEGFGIPPLEAIMNGCKVICSNQTAMADFEFFGKYLFDPNNFNELKDKIVSTLQEKKYPFEEIQKAIRERYCWRKISEKFSERIKLILNVNS